MPQRVQAPDGEFVEFPDGMTDDAISAVMRQHYGGPDERPTSQALGFAQGLAHSVGRMGEAASMIPGLGKTDAERDAETRMGQWFANNPNKPGAVGDFIGKAVGTAPLAALPGGIMAQGAAMGVAQGDSTNPLDMAKEAALGAVAGKVGEKAVQGIGNAVRAVQRPAAQALRDAGISLTPGQALGGKAMVAEDKLMSRPVIGDKIAADRAAGVQGFNRAAVNKALEPIGVKLPDNVPTGHDAVAFAQQAISQAYENVVPKLSVQVDDKLFQGLQEVAHEARMLPDEAKKIVVNVVNGSGFDKTGGLAGDALQASRSELSRLAGVYKSSADAHQREAGRVLGWVRDHVDDAIMRQNPTAAPIFKAANRAFSRQTIIDDAASRADDGVFSTGQAKQAARRADMSRRKTATARGEGPMGDLINAAREILPATVPDSGTAGRLLQGNLFEIARGAASRAIYAGRKAATDAAARLPQGAPNAISAAAKPFGLGTSLLTTNAATAQKRY